VEMGEEEAKVEAEVVVVEEATVEEGVGEALPQLMVMGLLRAIMAVEAEVVVVEEAIMEVVVEEVPLQLVVMVLPLVELAL